MRKYPNAVIIVPVYIEGQGEFNRIFPRIYNAILALSKLGIVVVINQGVEFEIGMRNIFVFHTKKFGIWNAAYEAHTLITSDFDKHYFEFIIHNFAPLYFNAENTRSVLEVAERFSLHHVVAAREDIAASLGGDQIGYKRALLECFLTTLAGIVEFNQPDFSRDGFSGLQVFSLKRYLEWDWGWVKKTTWGGDLEGQLQSRRLEYEVGFKSIPHEIERDWQTKLGDGNAAVINMLDQARRLPILENSSPQAVRRARDIFTEVFDSQPWPFGAIEDLKSLLKFYNNQTSDSYLIDEVGE